MFGHVCSKSMLHGEAIQKSSEDDLPLNSMLHECFLETQKTVLGFTKTACFAEDRFLDVIGPVVRSLLFLKMCQMCC